MTAHEITITEPRTGRHQAVCSCGDYKSATYFYKGRAEDAGESHVRAKRRGAA